MKYEVLHIVEINGKTRHVGDILDVSEFRAANPVEAQRIRTADEPEELSEVDSLLNTGHIKLAE